MFYLLLLVAAGAFGYYVYKNGLDATIAAVTAVVVAAAAYLEGFFDKFVN